jgi:hypothetical protein
MVQSKDRLSSIQLWELCLGSIVYIYKNGAYQLTAVKSITETGINAEDSDFQFKGIKSIGFKPYPVFPSEKVMIDHLGFKKTNPKRNTLEKIYQMHWQEIKVALTPNGRGVIYHGGYAAAFDYIHELQNLYKQIKQQPLKPIGV